MIDQELLRQTVRRYIERETEGNVTGWCQIGDHKFHQSTIADFLSGRRDAGLNLLLRLCARMRLEPQNFYKSADTDVLRKRLGLLSKLIVHPDFPFGHEIAFEALAAHIETTYAHCIKDEIV